MRIDPTDRSGDCPVKPWPVHVEPRRATAERDEQRDRFDRRWGPWLDPDAALGPEQIRRGIARAEEMVLELLAEETTDDDEGRDS